ncbi:aspartyl protease family protein [Candidatus Poribacteria bacterium]|nr:aspartyl protease family protein [Candidatus Poribacteria bacterium]
MDTGASATCISSQVAQSVGLQPIGMRPMTSATHSVPVNVYLVDLLLPFGNGVHILNNVKVLEFIPVGGSPFQMLVGRDIICRGTFTISFDGHFTFSL